MGIPRVHPTEAGPRRRYLIGDGPIEAEPEIMEKIRHNHKRLSFWIRKSEVIADSNCLCLQPHSIPPFLSFACNVICLLYLLGHLGEKVPSPYSQGSNRSNDANVGQLPMSFGVRDSSRGDEPLKAK